MNGFAINRTKVLPKWAMCCAAAATLFAAHGDAVSAAQTDGPHWVWWEAEDAAEQNFPPRGYFAPANAEERNKLSGGRWLQHHRGGGLKAKWQVQLKEAGRYAFWTRKFWKHGPFRWRWNGGQWQTCGRGVALADDVIIRKHVNANWVYLGDVELPAGRNVLEIEVLPEAAAVAFDCFLLIRGPFLPDGSNKPGSKYNRAEPGWFPFEPDMDPFTDEALLDLRYLNQKRAGEEGHVRAKGMQFVFEKTGRPVRFWAVNARCEIDDRASVRYLARRLAKLGVNMVRVHGPVWDQSAADLKTINKQRLDQLHYFVKAMADEGIYTKISFYFPLWVSMKQSYGFAGYKRGDHPFALLFFHPRFQEIYKFWARQLLTSTNPYTGKSLAEDPAVAIAEVVNEDNFLFWTFKPGTNPPAEMMRPLEASFGRWLVARYGSLEAAMAAWGGNSKAPPGDDFAHGRVALYDAGRLTNQPWARSGRNPKRARDQLRFLTETLRQFYADMAAYFRNELGVRCLISATNWRTADQQTLGALDKYTNLVCDVMDRHAYFSSDHAGEAAAYSLRVGQTYVDRSGLFGPDSLTKELQYVGHPHIVSEYNHPMPNRFRAEVPFLAATYGRLCGTDAYFHFALNRANWLRSHTKFSIDTPVVMGQFPAAALIFRLGYVREGPVVSHSAVRLDDLYAFRGTPVAEPQNLDQLRQADIPPGGRHETDKPTAVDPLAWYVGQVTIALGKNPGRSWAVNLASYIDHDRKIVRSATGELVWNWDRGTVALSASHAQGRCGFLGKSGEVRLPDVTIRSDNEYGAVLLVSLDGHPLAQSRRMLLQVMSEDRNYGWKTEEVQVEGRRKEKIVSLGAPPIVVRNLAGTVRLTRPDAQALRVVALDLNGYPQRQLGDATHIDLLPDCLYYIITAP